MADYLTVLIPTRNRANFLSEAIASALSQSESRIHVVVLDNASDDSTPTVVGEFHDSRLRYLRCEHDIGIIANWNRGLAAATTPYINILGDDDIMHPTFAERSIRALENHQSAGFAYTRVNQIDRSRNSLGPWGYTYLANGLHEGRDYILESIRHACCLTLAPSVTMRLAAVRKAGRFEALYAFNTFDFNLWLRLAMLADVVFLDEVLLDYRVHAGQMTELYWRMAERPMGALGSMLELLAAGAALLRSGVSERQLELLKECLPQLVAKGAECARKCVPDL